MSSEVKNDEFIYSNEPSMEKISDYHKPLGDSKKRTIFITMGAGIVLALLVYILASSIS